MFRLPEYPRVEYRAAANHDRVTPRVREDLPDVFRRYDVAVDDHRDTDRLLDPRDPGVIDGPFMPLFARPAMYGECRDAGIFTHPRDIDDADAGRVPSEAGLERHRHLHGFDDGGGELLHFRDVAEEPRTGPPHGDIADPATAVDVNEVRIKVLGQMRRTFHRRDIPPVDLYADWAFLLPEEHLLLRLPGTADEPVRIHKLRVDDVRPHPLANRAEREIRDILHGSEEYPLLQVDIADSHT